MNSLEEQIDSLRKLLLATLLILLVMSASIDLFMFRQVLLIRKETTPLRAQIEEYDRTKLKELTNFVSQLQVYSKTHPDVVPILNKYGVAGQQQVNAPAQK